MLVLSYILIALSLTQFAVVIVTGLMKAFEVPVKRQFLIISSHSMSAYFGLLGSIALLYLVDPIIFQLNGKYGIAVKLCIALLILSIVFHSIGYFVDRRPKTLFKNGAE